MKTEIFSTYAEFLKREDKHINGVSEEFAKNNPDYISDNYRNVGCYNCKNCDYCNYCDYCDYCDTCKNCKNCDYCDYCYNCKDCDKCKYCKDCNDCQGLIGESNK